MRIQIEPLTRNRGARLFSLNCFACPEISAARAAYVNARTRKAQLAALATSASLKSIYNRGFDAGQRGHA